MPLTERDLTHVTGINSDEQTVETTLDEMRASLSPAAYAGETMLLNMGPQHPSTHGVLRLMLELDGENVINVIPDIGFLHTGIEKNMEAKTFEKALVMTDRIDYLNNMGNNLAYCLAIEKLCGLDVPERAQYIRVIIAELQRSTVTSYGWAHTLWTSARPACFCIRFREREYILDMFEMVGGQRMMASYIRPGGVWRDLTPEFIPALRKFLGICRRRSTITSTWSPEPDLHRADAGHRGDPGGAGGRLELSGPYLRGSGVNYDVRKAMPYSSYDHFEFDIPLGTHGDVYDRYISPRAGDARVTADHQAGIGQSAQWPIPQQ